MGDFIYVYNKSLMQLADVKQTPRASHHHLKLKKVCLDLKVEDVMDQASDQHCAQNGRVEMVQSECKGNHEKRAESEAHVADCDPESIEHFVHVKARGVVERKDHAADLTLCSCYRSVIEEARGFDV